MRAVPACCCSLIALALPLAAAAGDVPVDVELVFAVDVSASVDMGEARLQRQGHVDALRSPEVIRTIQSGMFGRIAVAYVEWADASYQHVVVDWMEIHDAESAEAFAAALDAADIQRVSITSISGAIDFAASLFDANGFEGTRRVIDVSGDGDNNSGRLVSDARDAAITHGIIINGLPIIGAHSIPDALPSEGLEAYYRENVIGGPGSFLVAARGFEDFGRAIQAKLVLEIAGLQPEDLLPITVASLDLSGL